ncbi:MAG: hypothetical protein IJY08_06410 [Clostridia bacterium]|nr:hypothetical protein [Clostridia bacterium]
MKKRFLSLILATLMLVFALASCSGDDNTTDTDAPNNTVSTETGEQEMQPVFSGNTYDNRPFNVLCRKDTSNGIYESDINVASYGNDATTVQKAVYNRNIVVEDILKIRFNFVSVVNTTIENTISTSVLVGETDSYDLIVADGRTIFNGVLGKDYVDWTELEYVNLDAPWWSQNAREEWTTVGDRLFAMNGDLSYMSVGSANVMYFNRDIFENNSNLISPYDHVKNNTWTLESFKISVTDADAAMAGEGDGSGNIKTDTFGYISQCWRGPIQAMYCAGISTLVKGGDGKYSIGLESLRFSDAFGAYDAIVQSSSTYYTSSLSNARSGFTGGMGAYFDDNVSSAVNYSDSNLNFGIVPWPKYDAEVEGYNALVGSGTNTFAVPQNTSAENRVRISEVLEAMAYYGYKEVISSYFDTVISYQAVQDQESYEMLQIIHENLHFDLGHYANFGGIGDIGKNVVDKKDGYQTVSTALTTIKKKVMDEFEVWYLLDVDEQE